MGPLSRYRYLYIGLLAMWVLFVALSGGRLVIDFFDGVEAPADKIANLTTQLAIVPFWAISLNLALSRPSGLNAATPARIFERPIDKNVMFAMALWVLGAGALVSGLLTGRSGSVFSSDNIEIFVGLFLLAVVVILFPLQYTRKAHMRLVLSSNGIDYSPAKTGFIRWEDVGDIHFVSHIGRRLIAIELTDPARYRQKKSKLMIYPAVFNVDPDAMMKIIQQERTLNLL